MPLRSVVVDDEPRARELLQAMLARHRDVELVGSCGDGGQAVTAILSLRPDVVFLDVQMPRWSGFDVLAALGEELPVAIVFVTAFDQYAVQAFDVSATDYLLKPFDGARLARAMERVRTRVDATRSVGAEASAADPVARLAALVDQIRARDEYVRRFAVRADEKVVLVRTEDVTWLEADGRHVRLHVSGASTPYPVRYTMQAMERALDPHRFVRVNRSAIVNVDHVQHLEPWARGEYVFVLRTGRRIVSTHTYRAHIESLLRGGGPSAGPADTR